MATQQTQPTATAAKITKPRTSILYGKSRTGKTTQLFFIAKWLWEQFGLHSRLISGDPGGFPQFEDEGYIEQGITQVFDFSSRSLALADIRRLSAGYWPRLSQDGKEYFQTNQHCLTTPEEWNQIGAYLIDGFTGMGNCLLAHAARQEGGMGFKEAWKFVEDGELVQGLQQGHYGIVQKELYERHSLGFACLPIRFLIWTALEGKGTSQGENDTARGGTIYGPEMVGSATTTKIPTWFVDCFHIVKQSYVVQDQQGAQSQQTMYGAFYQDHKDPETGIPYLCGGRISTRMLPDLGKRFPYGYVPLTVDSGIEKWYQALIEIRKSQLGQVGGSKNGTA